MTLLTENQDVLDEIAKTLIEKEKINGIHLLDLIKDLKPNIIPEGAVEAVKQVVADKPTQPTPAPAMGAS